MADINNETQGRSSTPVRPLYTKMDPADKAQWCAALRSGEYSQCRGVLYQTFLDARAQYCCLGVNLVPLHGFAAPVSPLETCLIHPDGPHKLSNWRDIIGLTEAAVKQLIEMNDGGKTFAQIADWIEENL